MFRPEGPLKDLRYALWLLLPVVFRPRECLGELIMRKTKGRTCKRERYNWPVPETLLGQKRAYTEFRTLIEHRTQLIILRRVGRLLAVPVFHH